MKKIEILPSCIRKNKTLSYNKIYIVQGEVRVLKNIKVNAQDGVTILLVNGVFKDSCIRRSILIFDQGSKLFAKKLTLKAANSNYKPIRYADNGGIWFIGNYANASKDDISVKVNRKNPLSRFVAHTISGYYLGRKDQYISPKSGKLLDIGDDIDGISILGLGPTEWEVDTVKSFYSADDGIDLTNSHIRLNRLEVKEPTEDGINLSSSRLEIHRSITLDVSKTKEADRDLFDLEADDGASYLELYRGCKVKLNGVFGDQLVLSSSDMPKPNTQDDNEKSYAFEGKLKRASLIYSIDEN